MSTALSSPRSTSRAFLDTVNAELSKLVTLPAIWLTFGGTLSATLVLVFAFTAERQRSGHPTSALEIGLAPTNYIQAGFLILGVIAACAEYVGGQIRTTLTTIPQRIIHRTAAAIVLTIVTFIGAAIVMITSAGVASFLLADSQTAEPGVLIGTVLGAVSYLTLMTLLASGVGVLLRRSLPAVAILLGYVLVAGPLIRNRFEVSQYLPDTAGHAMWSVTHADAALSTATAWGTVAAWTLTVLIVAAMVYERRDA